MAERMSTPLDSSKASASNATSNPTSTNAASQPPTNSTEASAPLWAANSNDIGWQYGYCPDESKKSTIICKLCAKKVTSGVNRLKQHIANVKGDVAPCKKATDEDKRKFLESLMEGKERKISLSIHELEVRREVHLSQQEEEEEQVEDEVQITGAKKRKHNLGPMDKYASSIHPSTVGGKNLKQQVINDSLGKQRTHEVHQYMARWVYESGIPFHAIDNDSFRRFVEAVGRFGPGYKPPTQYQLREPLLKEEVERTKKLLKEQEYEWAKNGCSIMTDAWSDGKRRSIMNLCVNGKGGTTFLSSKEASHHAHTGDYIFEYVDKCIEEVGSQNVIQVVTDNASNNMSAARKLKEKRPHMFWTSCATHTINLMLQAIGNLPRFKPIIEKAKAFTVFIYAHHKTLAMMRSHTKRDIVRPGVTRFASSFLTLQSLLELKHMLRTMFASEEWTNSKYAMSAKGIKAFGTIMSMSFWKGVEVCLKVFEPLVIVLRLVDGDKRPSMGFLYGELQAARKAIKEVYNNQEANYGPIIEIIDAKARGRLDSPLHLMAYLLNPYYFFKDEDIFTNEVVMEGAFTCNENFHPDDHEAQNQVMNVDIHKYKNKVGAFGRDLARVGCEKNDDTFDPVSWWHTYGSGVPKLQRMAIRILSLTTSSSGCERNWSTFEGIHTKKRNRLDATRMSNLVYVQFNAKLINKRVRKERGVEPLLSRDSIQAQEWLVDLDVEDIDQDGLEVVRLSSEVIREIDEEDFVSDEEDEDEGDYDNDALEFNEYDVDEKVYEVFGGEEILV